MSCMRTYVAYRMDLPVYGPALGTIRARCRSDALVIADIVWPDGSHTLRVTAASAVPLWLLTDALSADGALTLP